MKISIIIPTLNEAAVLSESIERAWECGADEVVVVDGGSSDATVAVAMSAKCELFHSPSGRGIQLNAGARQATGDIYLFLHADTWLSPGACQQIRDLHDRNEFSGCGVFRQRIENSGWLYRMIELGNQWRVRWWAMAYGDQGIFVTKELYQALDGFDEIPLMEDFNFSRRLKKIARYHVLPGPLNVSARRWQRNGPLRQTMSNWWTIWSFLRGVPPEELAQQYRKGMDP